MPRHRQLWMLWMVGLAIAGRVVRGAEGPVESAADRAARAQAAIDAGRAHVAQANAAAKVEEKNRRLADARREFRAAKQLWEAAESDADARLKHGVGHLDTGDEANQAAHREQALKDRLEAGLFQAGVLYELATTWPAKDPQYREWMTAAADKFQELYQRHPTLAGGIAARMWQGRVARDLGQADKAAEIFASLRNLPENDETFRRLRDQSLVALLEIYLLPETAKYPEAFRIGREWSVSARAGRMSEATALRIHSLMGRAAYECARAATGADAAREEYLAAARKSLEFVARCPGESQREARRLLSDPLFGDWFDQFRPPGSYAEARFRGDFAWERVVAAQQRLAVLSGREEKERAGVAQALRESRHGRELARRYYRDALRLVDGEVPVEQRNETRFRLAYLGWAEGDWAKAAVLGEFLARRYPDSRLARPAAEIAAKAYRLMYRASNTEDARRAVAVRLGHMAEYLHARWPGSAEADTVWMMAMDTAKEGGDPAGVALCLSKIPPGSPRRGMAERRAWDQEAAIAPSPR